MTVTAPRARGPRSLGLNTLVTAGSNVIRGAVAFAATVVLTRELSTAARGSFSFVTNAVLLLVMLAGLGMSTALTWAKAKDARTVNELYSAASLLGIVFGVVAGAAFLVAYAVVPGHLFRGVTFAQALIVALLVPPLLVLSHWNVMAYLEDRIPEFSIAVITGAVAFLIGVVALSLRTHLTATNVSLVWAVTSVLPLVIVFRPVRAARMWETRSVASALVRFSLKANVATLALILAWRVDIFLVKGFRGLSELGLYAVAVGLAEIMLQIAVSFRIALTPLQGSADRRDTLVSSICRVSRITLAAGALTALVVALTATPIVRGLYGNRYADAGAALAWLMPGIVALVLQGPFIDYLLIEGQLKAVTVATVVALLINVGMNVALLQHHTFVAASVASTVSYFVSCVWCMWLFARTTGCSLADMVLIRRADVTAVLRRRARTTS